MTLQLRILELYPADMNVYGDRGNGLAVQLRAKQWGLRPELLQHNVGDTFPDDVDLVLGGGGQDSGQLRVASDLPWIRTPLTRLAMDGVPMLMVCGMYQLFGHEYVTPDGQVVPGLSLLDVATRAGADRLTGNVTINSPQLGELIGYENHSGQTTLGQQARPLGRVVKGMGNNGEDGTEGARAGTVIGTYLHGPVLPKNPRVTDWLIGQAVRRRHPGFQEPALTSDPRTERARQQSRGRPR